MEEEFSWFVYVAVAILGVSIGYILAEIWYRIHH